MEAATKPRKNYYYTPTLFPNGNEVEVYYCLTNFCWEIFPFESMVRIKYIPFV